MDDISVEFMILNYKTWDDFLTSLSETKIGLLQPDFVEQAKCLCKGDEIPGICSTNGEDEFESHEEKTEVLESESSDYESVSSASTESAFDIKCPEKLDFCNENVNLNEFLGIRNCAKAFVDDILATVTHVLRNLNIDLVLKERDDTDAVPVLTIQEFTPKVAIEYIEKFVNTWEKGKHWQYYVQFLSKNSNACFEYYIYEVKWSKPMKTCPIPPATASVFFIMEISRMIPPKCPVKITYSFEGNRTIYNINDRIQHMKFIESTIKTKLKFFQSITF